MANNSHPSREFNIHEFVRVQLEGTGIVVPEWLTCFEGPINGNPDITVQFIERLDDISPVRFIELRRYGYTESSFVAYSKGKSRKASIPLENIGGPYAMQCEAGVDSLPLFEELVHLAAINAGGLPLHASAFQYKGKTILAGGYPHGGKTSLLLAFTEHEAIFMSDDWTYLDTKQQVYGIPLPITLRGWQVAQLPSLQSKISKHKRLKQRVMTGLSKAAVFSGPKSSRAKLVQFFQNRANVTVNPEQIFGKTQGDGNKSLTALCLTMVHDSDTIIVEATPSERALPQLVQMQMNEWQPFLNIYEAYKAAMPGKYSVFLDNFKQNFSDLIKERLNSIPIYSVYHPHPVNLSSLFDNVRPYLDQ
ncbi:MAG: hypothetical protein L0154_21830 [Chloroflexi bacterium]|nr:hypothetical protein [Chloroflexota bacterium]